MSIKSVLEKIAGSFQPAYDRIAKWDCPPLREFNRKLWDSLTTEMQAGISALATALYKKYGEQAARDILADLQSRLTKILK